MFDLIVDAWEIPEIEMRRGNYSGQKKKLSAPEEGQNFPPVAKSQTFWVPVYSHNTVVQRKFVPH